MTSVPCSTPGCGNLSAYVKLQICTTHYSRLHRTGALDKECVQTGCGKRITGRASKCEAHSFTCDQPGCVKKPQSKGALYCNMHRERANGTTNREMDAPSRYADHPNGWRLDEDGYMIRYRNGKKERQHRYVMEQHLGRSLRPDEEVHHKFGDRTDNRLDRLELWVVGKQPHGQRVQDKLEHAVEMLELYRDEMPKDLQDRLDTLLGIV